jgi:YggT family protein
MNDVLAAVPTVVLTLRSVMLAVGAALAAIAAADWAVRTRRISPFSGIARFLRARVDPRLAGIERQVVRVGGHPASTPWWALVVYVVFAMLLIAAIGIVASLVHDALVASSLGAVGLLMLVVSWTFEFLRFALLVRVITSWFPALAHRWWISWSFGATEWMLRPLRRIIPTIGVIDVTPLVAYFALQIVQRLTESLLFPGIS